MAIAGTAIQNLHVQYICSKLTEMCEMMQASGIILMTIIIAIVTVISGVTMGLGGGIEVTCPMDR